MTTSSKTNKKAIVCHGMVTHPLSETDNCLECLNTKIAYYKVIRKAGGMKKFVEKLKNEH